MDCLDGQVSIINDQDARASGVVYLNDLPEFTIDKMAKTGNLVTANTTLASAVLSNISLNTSNFNVGDSIEGHNIPDGTTVLNIINATSLTMSANATATEVGITVFANAPGLKLISDIISFAQNKIRIDVLANLQGCLKRTTILRQEVTGFYRDFENLLTVAGAFRRGIQLKVDSDPYVEIYIRKIRLFLNVAIVSNILVYDLIEGRQIDSIPFTSVANEIIDVIINKAYGSDKQEINLLFTYDGSLAAGYRSTTSKGGNCTGCGGNRFVSSQGAQIAAGAAIQDSNVTNGSETYGMSITYALNCTVEPFLCSIREFLQYPTLYLAASMLMEHAQYDQRINSFITIGKGDHKELAIKYEQEYNVQLFGGYNEDGTRKIQQGIMDSLSLPEDLCFKARAKIRNVTSLP